jgi:hypothetical protein
VVADAEQEALRCLLRRLRSVRGEPGIGMAAGRAVGRGDGGQRQRDDQGGECGGGDALHRVLLGRGGGEEHGMSLRPARRGVVHGRDIGNVTAAT